MSLDPCWNKKGVWGDGTCEELPNAVHCRNCGVYSQAASELLDREIDPQYRAAATEKIRAAQVLQERATGSAVIFRIGSEWLALPTRVFHEVCTLRPIHSLPHRRHQHVVGIVNVRGALLICVSLHALLGIEAAAPAAASRNLVLGRLLVAGEADERLVFPVDEIHGIHRYHPAQLGEVPATISKATATYTRSMLSWQNRAVGLLDDELLFPALNSSLS
jgi:chemotaxis-related protein WspD